MKNLFVLLGTAFLGASALNAQMLYKDSHVFVGQKPSDYLNVGSAPGVYIGPEFGIEYIESGINVWRPYPSANYGNYKLFLDQSGRLGIGRKPTTYKLEVEGQVWTTSGLLITSDGLKKKNIKSMGEKRSDYVGKVKKLQGKTYEKEVSSSKNNAAEVAKMVAEGKIRKEDEKAALKQLNAQQQDTYKEEYGFIAQEVKELFPELVEENAEGVASVNYTGLIPVLLEAIKDLQDKVEKLEKNQAASVKSAPAPVTQTANEGIATSDEYLSQNVPNPFTGTTEIRYSLPENAARAVIVIYSASGAVVKTVALSTKEKSGSITLSSSDLATGTYVYTLAVNDIVLATKKMINQ